MTHFPNVQDGRIEMMHRLDILDHHELHCNIAAPLIQWRTAIDFHLLAAVTQTPIYHPIPTALLVGIPLLVMTDDHYNHATICGPLVRIATVSAITGIVFNICRGAKTVGMPMTIGSPIENILPHTLIDLMDDLMAMGLMGCLTRSGVIGGRGVGVRIV